MPCAAPAGGIAPGRVEIWYYPGTPASPGSPTGIGTNTPATFTSSQAANCFGAMAEFSPPPHAAICVLDAAGLATDVSGTSFSVATAGGNVAGDLGIAVAADFFDTSVPAGAAWTVSQQGWTQQRQLSTGTTAWAAWRDLTLPVGPQSLTASFTDSTGHAPGGQQGWALALAAFRAVVFQPLHLDGAEMATMVALDPTGQELILGGDVEGLWRTADFGDHWQLSQDGLYGQKWRFTACVAWSLLEQDTVYACVGENAATGNGGFLVSTDGGVTWSRRSTQVQFQGNAAGSPPLPAGEM